LNIRAMAEKKQQEKDLRDLRRSKVYFLDQVAETEVTAQAKKRESREIERQIAKLKVESLDVQDLLDKIRVDRDAEIPERDSLRDECTRLCIEIHKEFDMEKKKQRCEKMKRNLELEAKVNAVSPVKESDSKAIRDTKEIIRLMHAQNKDLEDKIDRKLDGLYNIRVDKLSVAAMLKKNVTMFGDTITSSLGKVSTNTKNLFKKNDRVSSPAPMIQDLAISPDTVGCDKLP